MQYIHLIYLQLCPNVSLVIGGMHDDNDVPAAMNENHSYAGCKKNFTNITKDSILTKTS